VLYQLSYGSEQQDDAKNEQGEPDGSGRPGAGEGNRTLTTSLEGWSSTIELHPRSLRRRARSTAKAIGHPRRRSIELSVRANAAGTLRTPWKDWWAEQDSNLRRLSRQIYSLVHLAALVSARRCRARDPLRSVEPDRELSWRTFCIWS